MKDAGTERQILSDSRVVRAIRGRRKVPARSRGNGSEEGSLMDAEFQFYQMKRVLDSGCTAMQMHLTLPNSALKNGQRGRLGRLRQGEFEASLNYRARPCLKTNTKTKIKTTNQPVK